MAAADTTTPYSVNWATTGVTDGLYDLRVTTTDKAGNTFTSPTITNVLVDNTAPVASVVMTGGTPDAFQNGSTIYYRSTTAGSFGSGRNGHGCRLGSGVGALPRSSTEAGRTRRRP